MKKILLVLFTFLGLQSFSQTYNLSGFEPKEMHNSIRLNYILIDQPNRTYDYFNDGTSTYTLKPTMGLFGFQFSNRSNSLSGKVL